MEPERLALLLVEAEVEVVIAAACVVVVLIAYLLYRSPLFGKSPPASLPDDAQKKGKNKRKKVTKLQRDGDESYHSDYENLSSDAPFEFSFCDVVATLDAAVRDPKRGRRRRRQEEGWDDGLAKEKEAEGTYQMSDDLRRALLVGKTVPYVDVSGLPVGVDFVSSLKDVLVRAPGTRVQALRMDKCGMSNETVRQLGAALCVRAGAVLSLCVARNQLGWKGLKALVGPSLMELDASDASLFSPSSKQDRARAEKAVLAMCGRPSLSAAGSSQLTVLNLANNGVGVLGCEVLLQCADGFPQLRHLDLSRNNLQNKGAAAVATLISRLPSLISLHLGRNSISANGAESLAAAVSENTKLESLDLRFNRLGDRGAAALFAALSSNQSLASLHLRATSLSGRGLGSLSRLLSLNTSKLRVLNLSRNSLAAKDLAKARDGVSFYDAIVHNTHLAALSLADNPLVSDFEDLASALAQNKALTSLSVANTKASASALRTLCAALSKNLRVTSIDLSHNDLNTETLRKIARIIRLRSEGLAPIPAPRVVLLTHHTAARDTGLRLLLQSGMSLNEHCDLSAMELSGDALSVVFDTIAKPNRSVGQSADVSQLNLAHNELTQEGWAGVCSFLSSHPHRLLSLNLTHTHLDDAAAALLAGALPKCSLATLRLEENAITEVGLEKLAIACESNSSLTTVVVSERLRHCKAYQSICASLVRNRAHAEGFHLLK